MSDTTALPAEDSNVTERVDAHLQRWRTETERRRNEWATKQAAFVADQQERRQRTMVFASAASVGFLATLAIAGLAFSQLNAEAPAQGSFTAESAAVVPEPVDVVERTSEPVAPVAAAPVEAVQAEQVVAEPVADAVDGADLAVAEPVVESAPTEAAVAPVAAPAMTGRTLDLNGADVTSWTDNGTLWIQVDTVPGRELRWLDAAGTEVLERTPCSYAIADGGMRCYIGRTASRIGLALDAGAVPGDWTAELCEGDRCARVATYPVTR